jgi:adenylate kinase family enzyme
MQRNIRLSEAELINLIRLEASNKGARLWRNNVGAVHTADGSFLRYGLANDSKTVNDKIKSADLIGIKPVIITQEMVGKIIGQFISREVKCSNWVYRDTPREKAQAAWMYLINSLGGDAAFTTKTGEL